MTATAAPPDVAEDGWQPATEQCAFCDSFEITGMSAMGDAVAYRWHHDCPDQRGRDGWTKPDILTPRGKSRGVRYRTRPRDVDIEDQIRAALDIIHNVALSNREVTAGSWRIRCDQAGVSEQARSDAARRAVTIHHWLEVVDLFGGRVELDEHDRRTPRYRSLIHVTPRPAPRGVDPRAGKPRL